MPKRLRLGEVLVEAGVLTAAQIAEAVEYQKKRGRGKGRLGSVIFELGMASEEEVAVALSQQLGIPFVDLGTVSAEPELIQAIPRRVAERHLLVPVAREGMGILVAMADPTDVVALDDVRVATRLGEVHPAVSTMSAVREAIDRFYTLDSIASEMVSRLGAPGQVEVVSETPAEEDLREIERSSVAAPIVRLMNAILSDSVRGRATDIHIEPQQRDVKVRYRVDGILREMMTLPKAVQASLVSRVKIMSGMDIAERRRPQDGRSKITVDRHEVALRVSAIPTMLGEKVVIRLLPQGQEMLPIDQLGMDDDQLAILEHHISAAQGFILFTGPTGSGKTTTLYSAIRRIKTSQTNIVTLEDPIEYQIPGVNQIQMDEKSGVTFARGLRSVLRQDPNVIMVGEVRDLETAQIALQCAMTGHLVFSTVHTNDAASAVTRLVDIGVEPYLVASSLSLVVAQRLVRVICDRCRVPAKASERTLGQLGLLASDVAGASLSQGAGCEVCGSTGYRGRVGLYEMLPVTRRTKDQIKTQVSDSVIGAAARAAGMRTLREVGLDKAKAGITTLEEVLRATQVESESLPLCPSCRRTIEPGFIVCPYCETDLGEHDCPGCGKAISPEWSLCPYCRTVLGGRPTSPRKAPSDVGRSTQASVPAESLDSGTGEPAAAPPAMSRVLVVDDDANLRSLVATMFDGEYEVIEAATGSEAVRRAASERPDLILLDLGLPDLPGIQVVKRLRKAAATRAIPVIALTGDETKEVESLRAGIDDYVTKPFEEEKLRARIESALRRHAAS